MTRKKRIVIGFLGVPAELGRHPNRWQRWRPTVAMHQHESFHVDRLELIHRPAGAHAAQRVRADIHIVSPRTTALLHSMELKDASDFEEVYCALRDFAQNYPFAPGAEEYFINLTTFPAVAQISWLLLIEAGLAPAKILHVEPPLNWRHGSPGTFKVIDTDLSRYGRIAARYRNRNASGLPVRASFRGKPLGGGV
jgi:transcriptional regulatory protein RtcR